MSLLAQTSDTNRSTAAEEARQFSIFGVQPLAAQLADALSQFLLSPTERASGQRVVLDLRDALLGYGQERAAYASTLVNSGLASRNELRNLLGLPDTDGGDALAVPSNTLPLDQWLQGQKVGDAPAPVLPPDPTKSYTPPSPSEATSSAEIIDWRAHIADARFRAAVAPTAFAEHCHKLAQG